jgi:hypothetical protein
MGLDVVQVRPGRVKYPVPQEKVCVGCLHEILSFIKSSLSGASEGDIFELRYDMMDPGVFGLRKVYNTSKLEVVPAWFKEWVYSNKPTTQQT